MATQPEPQLLPSLDDPSSALSRKYGRETVNYFSGVPVNRLAWLRTDYAFLRRAFQFEGTRFIAVKDLNPLTDKPDTLSLVPFSEIAPITGEDPFGPSEDELITNFDSSLVRPLVIFIGVLENEDVGFEHKGFKGRPVFAIDVSAKGPHAAAAEAFAEQQEKAGKTFLGGRVHLSLNASDAAMFAQARSTIDWNTRNQFCGGCGQRTLSGHAGYKRVCPPTDLAGGSGTPTQRGDCATRKGVSNLSFPRTDPVIIAAVLSADGTRVLLGRARRYPPNWYSTLAGFLEPGESIEEATRREILEESGVRVGRVVIHSSQPWPYPASLMIGAVAQALPGGETIDLGNDPELEDAKWVPLEELREALKNGVSGLGDAAPEGYKEGNLRLPPHTAIANRLLTAVADEAFVSAQPRM
ncbi:peroxisomal NADH pyrophosphatase NUDT12 [Plectosphaerella cucumerina]|uniref:NAD(+) diphosphatase n=1 Tax=Plectosphaerella cucumerina TaxID=40658 RepID=A0A8K0T449_9PEZI|nr:peroxisomal NADH pyrophosphatase NUDT12 [Plectosphaerella cucumerina]